jgi:4-hydroxyacetophenone monooxygenase
VLDRGARRIEVDRAVHDEYAERHQEAISRLVWAHPAITHSHYKNPSGRVYTLSPWAMDDYWAMTRHLDPEAYRIS